MSSDDVTAAPAPVLDGRYVLESLLGRGGMAEVYQARDTVLERDVAIKLFHQTGTLPDGELRRSAEVRLLAGFSHRGLVTLFDAGRDASNPADPFTYLVMELVPGTTLARLIADGPLPREQVASIGEQLADALAYVHARGVVHRDIKPANVLVDTTGTSAKLADFGVARLVDSARLTVDGATLGTPDYLSPEQATGAPVGAASDIYSLGLVLLEALTGQRPFPGRGVEAAVVRVHQAPPIPGWVPPEWQGLLRDMTAIAPSDRPDAATVVRLLAGTRHEGAPTAVLAQPVTQPATPPRSRHRIWWLAAALAAVVVLAGVLIGVLTTGGQDPPAGSSATTPAAATPSYPPVAGALGVRVRALEATLPAELRGDALAVAETAARGDVIATRIALAQLAGDLRAAHSAGQVSDAQYAAVSAAIAAVSAQLSRTSTRSTPTPTPTRTSASTPVSPVAVRTSSARAPGPPAATPKPAPKHGPKPGKPSKPGKHKAPGPGPGPANHG